MTPREPAEVGLLVVAPSPEEEIVSQSTLALAPSVAVLANEVRQKPLQLTQLADVRRIRERNE